MRDTSADSSKIVLTMERDNAADAFEAMEEGAAGNRLPENCVEYMLFIIQDQLNVQQTCQQLETVRKAAEQLSQRLTKDYIWQHDEFKLELKNENGLVYLYGMIEFADAVEDEWLIVYLLRELTQSNPYLWVRVADSDGEFLLIEAASVLPKWLSPGIDHCRVWVHQGKLHIIPLDESSPDKALSLVQSIEILKSNAASLLHSEPVQNEAFYRLGKYPEFITTSMHHALATIPRKLAYILHSIPKTTAPAVECFYLRDPVALNNVFSPSGPLIFPPKDLVTVSVRFSKVLFAQLRSQRFDPPPSWQSTLHNEPSKHPAANGDSKMGNLLDIGVKLTSGFEMLAVRAAEHKSRVVREMALLLEDLEEDGEETLPSDHDMKSWVDVHRNDDETWLDINYDDFERELEGKRTDGQQVPRSGFGDAQIQENLRKIVARVRGFVEDDDAGLDGAELDSEDEDEDEDQGEEGSEVDDGEVDFNQGFYQELMEEMLGQVSTRPEQNKKDTSEGSEQVRHGAGSPDSGGHDEDRAIHELTSQMEAELKEFGALRIDDQPTQRAIRGSGPAQSQRRQQGEARDVREEDEEDEQDEDELDIDYNLAQNLLESFKSQGGMAGPVGNLMGLMGFQLPRDEDDHEEKGSR